MTKHYVIRSVLEGKTTQAEAGKVLRRSERQIRRMCARVRVQGIRGLVHGLCGRASNHQLNAERLEQMLSALHDPLWDGFGPKFASDKLEDLYGLSLGSQTVRRWMVRTGLWQIRKKGSKHRVWRPRRPSVGMLVQLDGSDHDWFEGRGPRCVLLIYIDDATSQILHAEFVDVEDTLTLMRSTGNYLRRWGRPIAFYVDKDSIYKVVHPVKYEGLNDPPITQFTRAMAEIGVDIILADTPQAKGRVERGFDTHQDRLVKEMRLRGISNKIDGNRYLPEYVAEHNQRYSVAAENLIDAHRPLSATHRLEQILSLRTKRVVTNDYTLRYDNKFFQLLEDQPVRVRPRTMVEVEQRLDGSTHLRLAGRYLNFRPTNKKAWQPLVARPSYAKYGPVRKHGRSRFFVHPPKPGQWQATATVPVWK